MSTSHVPDAAALLETIRKSSGKQQPEFNVFKLTQSRLSFLCYEHFSQPFPALLTALSCDVVQATSLFTEYSRRSNPPILHRKELLLPADHPLVPPAVQLTEELDRLGAFRRPSDIRHPQRLARPAAFVGAGNRKRRVGVVRMTSKIDRHRTARRRIALSSPMPYLLTFGFLDGSHSLFDYGRGRGDDLRLLAEMKVAATG